jgi:hypothetical protein
MNFHSIAEQDHSSILYDFNNSFILPLKLEEEEVKESEDMEKLKKKQQELIEKMLKKKKENLNDQN